MTALQKINLGTAPAGSDGDTARSAFSKVNSNVDVLNTQAALASSAVITAAQALTNAHVGKRVNINLTSAATINMPAASTCAADQVTLLRNIGTTVVTLAIATGSGDTVALSKLNPGESVLMDTDGVHAWSVLMRGRTNGDNEVVNGNETVGGTLSVTGLSAFAGGASFGIGGQAAISAAGAYSGVSAAYTGNVTVGGTLGVTGQATFSLRPTFSGKTPWDNGNLANPATIDTVQTISGAKTFSGTSAFTGNANFSGANGNTYLTAQVNISGPGQAGIGFNSGGIGGIWLLDKGSGAFQAIRYDSGGYLSITCASLTQASDAALKTDVSEVSSVLNRLRGKRIVSYRLKSDESAAANIGVIAQEWQGDFPELVVETGSDIDDDGNFIVRNRAGEVGEAIADAAQPKTRKALGFNYSNASAVALAGVMELSEQLQVAIARIAALEGKKA
ncbi:tail fiber domain-containing protein [Burkholderia vietnamiensis]|uniref:tail fiber domain-containing protein n=1 Tax=Burkholderia vietnamiensis TaxID=60552 RepID=UPI000A99C01A|nr:tail fiber domain-containing protein [Burkholderia vietnamiensis]